MKSLMRLGLVALLLGGLRPIPGAAGELSGFISLGVGQATYPAGTPLYSKREDYPWAGSLRLLAEAGTGAWHFSANLVGSLVSRPPWAAGFEPPPEVERSALLTWEQHDSAASRADLAADLLALQYRGGGMDLTLGRQPVSLATTFYFTPNDFFAPFAPQSFFRTYRPGVDALRVDILLESLFQAELLAVLAYGSEADSVNGWSRAPRWSRSALLARLNREGLGFGWSLLAGTVADRTLVGGGVQGELFDWLGIRGEGHYAVAEASGAGLGGRLALGLEHSYADGRNWRMEYFYNGYPEPAASLPGHHYGALGLGYEFTPLLTGGLVGLADFANGSRLFSANLLYSLSDEAELAMTGVIPAGRRPAGTDPGSEFARQPRQLQVEYRRHF